MSIVHDNISDIPVYLLSMTYGVLLCCMSSLITKLQYYRHY